VSARRHKLEQVILQRAMQILLLVVQQEEARQFVVKSNIIAPILNFVNSSSSAVINSWYQILGDLCRHPEFME